MPLPATPPLIMFGGRAEILLPVGGEQHTNPTTAGEVPAYVDSFRIATETLKRDMSWRQCVIERLGRSLAVFCNAE